MLCDSKYDQTHPRTSNMDNCLWVKLSPAYSMTGYHLWWQLFLVSFFCLSVKMSEVISGTTKSMKPSLAFYFLFSKTSTWVFNIDYSMDTGLCLLQRWNSLQSNHMKRDFPFYPYMLHLDDKKTRVLEFEFGRIDFIDRNLLVTSFNRKEIVRLFVDSKCTIKKMPQAFSLFLFVVVRISIVSNDFTQIRFDVEFLSFK